MRTLALVLVMSSLGAQALEAVSDQELAEQTGGTGLELNLDVRVNAGDVALDDDNNTSGGRPQIIANDLQGRMTMSGLGIDFARNTAAARNAVNVRLPSSVTFDHFGVEGVYIGNGTSIGTPPTLPSPPAAIILPSEKIYHIVMTTYGNCGDFAETCQGVNDLFKLRVTQGYLTNATGTYSGGVAGTCTGDTSSCFTRPGSTFHEYQRGSQAGVGRRSDGSGSAPYAVYGDCPGIFSSSACRNHWIEWRVPYRANAQVDLGGNNLVTTDNDPYLMIVDTKGTASTADDTVVASNNNHDVVGFANLNPQIVGDFGNAATWPSSTLPAAGQPRLLFGVEVHGRFNTGGNIGVLF